MKPNQPNGSPPLPAALVRRGDRGPLHRPPEHNGQAARPTHPGSAPSGLLWPGAGILRRIANLRDAGDVTNCAMLDSVRNAFRAASRRPGTSPKARRFLLFSEVGPVRVAVTRPNNGHHQISNRRA